MDICEYLPIRANEDGMSHHPHVRLEVVYRLTVFINDSECEPRWPTGILR